MKTQLTSIYKALGIAFILLISTQTITASHNFGGEITWHCQSNGLYIFKIKVYRDCNGIPQAPIAQINVYGHPTVCSIPINSSITDTFDLSPSNCFPNCATGGPGTTQEFVFTSMPVALPGVPPSTGWVFAIDECCRNSLENQPGGGGGGFTLRSVMYPYNNTSANPCFDSSPFFAERPNTYLCIGYPYTYNPAAIDNERDSLVYSWAECLSNPTVTSCTPFSAPIIGWQTPYSLNSQIPGNPTLNTQTGEINFFVPFPSAINGNFASCIKVTAYRCGVKIAEVYRDCGFTLVSGCLVVGIAPNNNHPPTVQPPFIDPNTGLQTSFIDTVVAGDLVSFNFSATDFESNLPGSMQPGVQTVTLTATGDYFGTGYTSDSTGCAHPPCATLNPPPPVINPIASSMQFNWQTSCNLVNNIQACTDNIYNTFYFILTAKDNACPANGASVATISITVTGPEIQHSNDSLWISYTGATAYQWYVDGVLIPGATDSLLVITGIPGFFFSCQMATASGCTLSSRLYYTPVGITELPLIRSVSIVPNPARENFTINIGSNDSKKATLIFTDVTGRVIQKETVLLKSGNNAFEYNTKIFSGGIYFVKIGEGKNAVTRKLVVQ